MTALLAAEMVRADWDEKLHPRNRVGEFTKKPSALSPVYNDVPETRGVSRTKGRFTGPTGREEADRAKLGRQPLRMVAEPITSKEARDESREVSDAEFQDLAREGVNQLGRLRAMRSPVSGLDRNWAQVKDQAWEQVQQSWGGVTVDAHTGEPLDSHADRYALSVKKAGMTSVSVPENATREQFDTAMDRALAEFRGVLEGQQSYLGVFHDDEEHRIDIDPVLVVASVHEVETIGAYTHAVGGAYHFRTGNGVFPPHIAEAAAAAGKRGKVHWKGPGQWRSEAERVQPGLSAAQEREIMRAAGVSARFNPDQARDRLGRWTSGPAGKLVQELPGRMTLTENQRAAMDALLAKPTRSRPALPDYETCVAAVTKELGRAVKDPTALRDGKDWYPAERRLNEERAKKYNVPVEIAAAVEAAISPRCGYAANQKITDDLLEKVPGILDSTPAAKLIASRRISGGALPKSIDQAIAILGGGPIETTLTGDKRRAFFSNITSPGKTDAVTIDTWMQRALDNPLKLNKAQADSLAGEKSKGFTAGVGRMILADAVRRAAAEHGLSPDQMQAVYWIWAKEMTGDLNPTGRGKGGHPASPVKASAMVDPDSLDDAHYDAELILGYLAWRKRHIPGRIDLGPPDSGREDNTLAGDNGDAWALVQADPRWDKLGMTLAEARKIAGGGVAAGAATMSLARRVAGWDEAKHPRNPKGGPHGGEFMKKRGTPSAPAKPGEKPWQRRFRELTQGGMPLMRALSQVKKEFPDAGMPDRSDEQKVIDQLMNPKVLRSEIKPGDRVEWGGMEGRVDSIDNGRARVWWDEGVTEKNIPVDELNKMVPAPKPKAPAAPLAVGDRVEFAGLLGTVKNLLRQGDVEKAQVLFDGGTREVKIALSRLTKAVHQRPKPATRTRKVPLPAGTETPTQAALRSRYSGGIKGKVAARGGAQAVSERVTLSDGSHAMRKQFRPWVGFSAKSMADAEELAYKVAEAIGGTGAEPVIRLDDDTVLMDFAEGAVNASRYYNDNGIDFLHPERDRRAEELFGTGQGVRIGVMDIVNRNDDRHANNFMFTKDGKPVPIDNSSTFGVPGSGARGPFRTLLEDKIRNGETPLTPEEISRIEAGLTSDRLKQRFDQLGESGWYTEMLARWLRLKRDMTEMPKKPMTAEAQGTLGEELAHRLPWYENLTPQHAILQVRQDFNFGIFDTRERDALMAYFQRKAKANPPAKKPTAPPKILTEGLNPQEVKVVALVVAQLRAMGADAARRQIDAWHQFGQINDAERLRLLKWVDEGMPLWP